MPTTTLTFGEIAENGPGMQKLGTKAATGLSLEVLMRAKQLFEQSGCKCELVDLVAAAGVGDLIPKPEPAYILVVRNGVAVLGNVARVTTEQVKALPAKPNIVAPKVEGALLATDESVDDILMGMASDDPNFVAELLVALTTSGVAAQDEMKRFAPQSRDVADMLLREQAELVPDKMAVIRGTLKNKRARWNLTFGDTAQEPDYEVGKGRIVTFAALPRLAVVRERLAFFFGKQAVGLLAEANYYYDKKCGIGLHGDFERRIVIAIRLGDSMPLVYQWYLRHASQGKRVDFVLNHGDCYAMSTKAVGTDWMSSSFPTLRHAAGAARYLTPKK